MRDSKVIQVVAIVAILGTVSAMVFSLAGGFGPSINSEPHQAAGAAIARQALSLLKPGGQITLIVHDTATFPSPATDFMLESFQRELRQAHASMGDMHVLQVDPLRRIEVPPNDFQKWIRRGNDGDVIVSFMGPPVLTAAQRLQLGAIKPAIVAFCPGAWPEQIDFRPLFKSGLLRAAIVSRRDQPAVTVKPENRQAWFDQNFIMLTAANVEDFVAADKRLSSPVQP